MRLRGPEFTGSNSWTVGDRAEVAANPTAARARAADALSTTHANDPVGKCARACVCVCRASWSQLTLSRCLAKVRIGVPEPISKVSRHFNNRNNKQTWVGLAENSRISRINQNDWPEVCAANNTTMTVVKWGSSSSRRSKVNREVKVRRYD